MGQGIPIRWPSQKGALFSGVVGSSGMKRKGRKHLPKVDSPQDREWERHERIEEAMHPFSDDPDRRRGPLAAIVTIAVLALVLLGILGLVIFT
jgi:hypothetical protein